MAGIIRSRVRGQTKGGGGGAEGGFRHEMLGEYKRLNARKEISENSSKRFDEQSNMRRAPTQNKTKEKLELYPACPP